MDEWNEKEQCCHAGSMRLFVSLSGKRYRIHICKDIIRVLGRPKYISLKVNKERDSFIVLPCEQKNVMSFKVPERLFESKSVGMRISSQGFIMELFEDNQLNPDRTYRIDGNYLEKFNVVKMDMKDAAIVE